MRFTLVKLGNDMLTEVRQRLTQLTQCRKNSGMNIQQQFIHHEPWRVLSSFYKTKHNSRLLPVVGQQPFAIGLRLIGTPRLTDICRESPSAVLLDVSGNQSLLYASEEPSCHLFSRKSLTGRPAGSLHPV